MEGFPVVLEHEILFRDLDAMGHVNNVAFVAFMEDARVYYWKTLRRQSRVSGLNFIIAEITCRYLSPATYGETLLIGIRVSYLGNKSFGFEYLMVEKDSGRPVVEARSVQVMYDYKTNCSIPILPEMRAAIEALEQRKLPPASGMVGPDGPRGTKRS